MTANVIFSLSANQLRRAAEIKEQIDALNSELGSILAGINPNSGEPSNRRRKMSAAGRARIAAAARARWAEMRSSGKSTTETGLSGGEKPKRKMSASAKAKIAAAARARWARVRANKAAA